MEQHDAVYTMAVAAELSGMHPQTLRKYERAGLLRPARQAGNQRRYSRADIRRLQGLGAAAVQLGTAFAVTTESDASLAFKQVLAGAKPEDLVEFTSVAGLPARAVRTPWLDKYLRIQDRMQQAAHPKPHCTMWFDCLAQCGLRDGHAEWGQFCIDKVLGHAVGGDVRKGLFFRGAGRLPFGPQIRPVEDLLRWLLGNILPPGFVPQEQAA